MSKGPPTMQNIIKCVSLSFERWQTGQPVAVTCLRQLFCTPEELI